MFGIFGGRFVAETLMPLILELDEAWKHAKNKTLHFRKSGLS